MKNNIAGKVVVIVDGASSLGAAGAHHLSNEGAIVVLGGAEIERVRKLAHELRWYGGKSIAVSVDASDGTPLEGLLAAAGQAFGRVDVMVNNAAASPGPGNVEWHVDRHVQWMLYGTAAALPHMQRQGLGQIINVLAPAGDLYDTVAQCKTVRAVLALSEGLREEYGQFNIRTTVISSDPSQAPGAGEGPLDAASDVAAMDPGEVRAEAFARALAFVINQPDDLSVSGIQFRPTTRRATIY